MTSFAAAFSNALGVGGSNDDKALPVVQGVPVGDDTPAPVANIPILGGFELWVPPSSPNNLFVILGTDAQIVHIPLPAGRQVMCFSGAMAYMSDGMKLDAQLFQGGVFGRLAGGGSLFQLIYTNETERDGYIALTPDYPGVVVPVHMKSCQSGKIIALRDSFLGSIVASTNVNDNTKVGAGFNPAASVAGFCCSGVDFIVQTIENGEWAFLIAMGTVITKTLEQGETIQVDTDSVLAFDSTVTLDIKWVGNIAAMCCGGEGLFNTTLKGPGKVFLQSMSIDKMRKLFPPKVAKGGGGDQQDGADMDFGGD